MNDEYLTNLETLYKAYGSLKDGSIITDSDGIDKSWLKLWEDMIMIKDDTYSNVTTMTNTTINYWTETQHKFLKRCCNANLRQFKVTVPGAKGGGHWYFTEVVFENVLNDGLYIIGKMVSGHNQTHTVPDTLSENSYIEMPIWVKNLMHQIFETYKVTKTLEK